MRNWKPLAIVAFLAAAALHAASVPRSIWEFDESYFAMAVERYQPLLHHPPPPGYPLYIGFAKLIALFTGNPLQALLATSIVAVAAGLVTWFLAVRAMTGSPFAAILGAALLYVSPAVLVSGTLPQSDAGALALFGLAAWGCANANPRLAAITCAACIGWRIQFAIAVVPMFVASLAVPRVPRGSSEFLGGAHPPEDPRGTPRNPRNWQGRAVAVALFGVACLLWFVPLVVATNGPASFWSWLSGQAAYYAAHDADLSRSGYSPGLILLRFAAHPWGPKWLSLPLLAVATGGATLMVLQRRAGTLSPRPREGNDQGLPAGRRGRQHWLPKAEGTPLASGAVRAQTSAAGHAGPPEASRRSSVGEVKTLRASIPLATGCLVYLAFALWSMDPADAVRYAIPSLPLVALLGAVALARHPALALLVIVYAAGSYRYAAPVLRTRTLQDAPPSAAASHIRANVPANAVVLYDLPLKPHAEYLLRGWKVMRIDAGLAKYGGDPAVPMVILADGERGPAAGVTFRWPDTDAYRKLTRQHYGAVSVIPLPPPERFRVVRDIHAPERRRNGEAWRWIGARGVIELPTLGATHARLSFRTPPDYPFEQNRVEVLVDGRPVAAVDVQRGRGAEVEVPVGTGPTKIELEPQRTFVPAKIPGANNRDARTLSVMLTRVQQLGARPGGG